MSRNPGALAVRRRNAAPISQESQADKSEREFRENFDRIANTDSLTNVAAKDIARAISWASRRKQSEGRKGWDGGQVSENLLASLDTEIERLKAEESNRERRGRER